MSCPVHKLTNLKLAIGMSVDYPVTATDDYNPGKYNTCVLVSPKNQSIPMMMTNSK